MTRHKVRGEGAQANRRECVCLVALPIGPMLNRRTLRAAGRAHSCDVVRNAAAAADGLIRRAANIVSGLVGCVERL